MQNERINMLDLKRELNTIGGEIKAAIAESLTDTIFINGPRVKRFEANVATYLGVKHAIGVANGTDAIHLALRGAGIKEGDEVITTPNTFFATVEACAYIGATPVFSDIDGGTLNIDPDKIESKITAKTTAILPVHLFGLPANMEKIMQIAEKHNLKVIEDCAQSFGAALNGKMTGSFGTAGTTSFYPTKNLGAYGDGGMVFTNDDNVADLVHKYREHGSARRYYHDIIGYNSRLDDIQAAILNVKLGHINKFNEERKKVAAKYHALLKGKVKVQQCYAGADHIYHQYTILVKNRDAVIDALNKADIGSSIFYPVPCHLQKSVKYLGYKEGSMPITERIAQQVLSIPIHQYITDKEIEKVAKVVAETAEYPE